jgi:general secretion pathway protein M
VSAPETKTEPAPAARIAKCAAAWLLLLLVPVALGVGIAWPWFDRLTSLDGEIQGTRDQLDRYQRLVATLPRLRAELEQVSNNQSFRAFYFSAATHALAGASLQQKVQDMVKEAGGRLVSTQILPSTANEEPPTVRVRIQLQGSTDQLLDVLYKVEEARPFLFVDQLSIRSMVQPDRPVANEQVRRVRRARPKPATEDLTVRLDIFGFTLGGA